MIIDIEKFIKREQEYWQQLEQMTATLRGKNIPLEVVDRFHYLYERCSSCLAQIQTYNPDPNLTRYLEEVVASAYRAMNQKNTRQSRSGFLRWFFVDIPQSFRRHINKCILAVLIFLLGTGFSAVAMHYDYNVAKKLTIPAVFDSHNQRPSDRVKSERENGNTSTPGEQFVFAAHLMVNNITVSFTALALGGLYGFGTILMLFYNGVILGTVGYDYIQDGQGLFLAGWLLPHGSIEIPAIILGGMAGFMIAKTIIGDSNSTPFKMRLRLLIPDMINICTVIVVLLIYAGIIESFVSQYHEPQLNVWVKIVFGLVNLGLLVAWLGFGGLGFNKKSQKQIAENL